MEAGGRFGCWQCPALGCPREGWYSLSVVARGMSAGASTVAKGSCATGCLEVLAWHLGVSSTAKAFKCQCCNCLCTQIVWKTSFIVLVLFKNVHNSDVIYKTGCLQDLFCILRCVYCQKKKKERMKNDVFLQLSAVTMCLYHCPPTVVPQGSPHHSCDPIKSVGKQVNPCTVLGRRFCALRMGPASFLFILLIYTVITMEMSLVFFFFVHSLLVVNMFFLYIK